MAFKSLSPGTKSSRLNASNHTHLQCVRKCSFCLMTYGHRKIIWHLFCIEMIRFSVQGVRTIPSSPHQNTMLSWVSAEILVRLFGIGQTTVTRSHQFAVQNEVITLCLSADHGRYYFNSVGLPQLTSMVNTVTYRVTMCSLLCSAELQLTKILAEMPEQSDPSQLNMYKLLN